MKNSLKYFALLGLLLNTLSANATQTSNIDANATREAIGWSNYSIIPLIVLVVFMVVLYFGTQKVPGLKD